MQCNFCELEATFFTWTYCGGIAKACRHCADTSDVPLEDWTLLEVAA